MPRRSVSKSACKTLGKNIERLRLRKNLSMNKAAEKFGMSCSMLSLIEAGKRAPSLAMLIRIRRNIGADWNLILEAVSDA